MDGRVAAESVALPRSVSRALRAIRADPARTLTVAVLARIANVSPRTLQRHFRKFLGKSPLTVSQDIKFEQVRRTLLRDIPGTVTEAAHRSGFRHLGRFSAEYAWRFGELPSQTLRRQRKFPRDADLKVSALAPIGDRPRIAILPIDTNDRCKEMARGLVDDLATALGRTSVPITDQVSAAHYHLRGTLRGEGQKFRLTSRLIDTRTSSHIWGHQYEAMGEKDFAFGEGVAERIAAALQPILLAAEVRRARRTADADVTAYDLTLRALPHAVALSNDGSHRALDLLERALASDPEYTLAVALASWCHAQRAVYPFSSTLTQDRAQALSLARRVVNSDSDATVLAVLGNTLALMGDLITADVVTRKALAICGSSSWAWARSGLIEVCNARPTDGIERLSIALDLASDDPVRLNCFMGLGVAHLEAGRFAHAAYWFERAVLEYPTSIWPHEFLGPAYVHCGRKLDAHKSMSALQHAFPGLTISRVTAGLPFFTQRIRDCVANGLETVGMHV
jgi:AraC-like DNA-binding protein/tetratricopeptide (TPR) repeat protein